MEATQLSLTDPIFLTRNDVATNSRLTNQFAILANNAFTRSKSVNPEKWIIPAIRFPDTQSVLEMIGETGTMAVILDESRVYGDDAEFAVEVPAGGGKLKRGKLVASSTITPWAGGMDKEGAGKELGHEMKAVVVDGDVRYLKKGLAIKILDALEAHIIEIERRDARREACDLDVGNSNGEVKDGKKGVLTLWILAAECLVGSYWRKRGYKNVRMGVYSGIWDCKTEFEIVVLKKEVEYSLE
jgi:hypothetical protein